MRGDQPLGEAGAVLVADRLKKATKLVKPARKGDPDGVHDLRVAIRKIRSAISVLEETVIDDGALRKQDRRLSRLFSALGDVRDHDVLASRVKSTAKRTGLRRKKLRVLVRALDRRRDEARRELRRALRSDEPARLFRKIGRDVVRAVTDTQPKRDDHRVLVRHFAASVLVRRYETVLAYELVVPASLEVLHRLRVAIKKLRYAIDFFADVLGKRARTLDDPLQTAQDQLGELHDHHVERALVANVERQHGSKRALGALRDADDAEAERLLAAFARSWRIIADGRLSTVLTLAAGDIIGRTAARSSTLALRRAESAR
jgi:CHAD domain-containing protein